MSKISKHTFRDVLNRSYFKDIMKSYEAHYVFNQEIHNVIESWVNSQNRIFKKAEFIQLAILYIFCDLSELPSCLGTVGTPFVKKGKPVVEVWTEKYGSKYAAFKCAAYSTNLSKGQVKRNSNPETTSMFVMGKEWYEKRDRLDEYEKNSAKTKAAAQKGDAWHSTMRDKRTSEYWTSKGYTQEEALGLIDEYIKSHADASINGLINSFKSKYGDNWEVEYRKFKISQAESFLKNPHSIPSKESVLVFDKLTPLLSEFITSIEYEWLYRHDIHGLRFYDAKFTFKSGVSILVEYDGVGWHYYEKYKEKYFGDKFGITLEQSLVHDKLKDDIAIELGYDIIRINSEMTLDEMYERFTKYTNS